MKKEKILIPKDPSNVKFPWLWIGTWSMGGEGFGSHDERESLQVLESAVEKGIRHFDTAGFYAHGRSEELLRKVISGRREGFFVSTKGGLVWDGRRVEHRASPKALGNQLHESLERLKVDYLDLYQLHWPDPEVPVRESIGALKELQGKELIRHWGIGNLTAKQIKENLKEENNVPHQVHFNPIRKSYSVLDAGKESCINCVITPLEQGLLGSGKSSRGEEAISSKDMRNRNPYFSNPGVLKWNKRLDDLCRVHSVSKVSMVLTWICSRYHVNAIIPGPRLQKQLDEILNAISFIEENELIDQDESDAIVSLEKAKNKVPRDIWEHLDKGPSL